MVREVRHGRNAGRSRRFHRRTRSQLAVTGGNAESLQRALAPQSSQARELAAHRASTRRRSDAQLKASSQDQQRLRENMKALRGSAEEKQLLQRYTRQLDDQENKLDALRREIAEHHRAVAMTARQELNALIAAASR